MKALSTAAFATLLLAACGGGGGGGSGSGARFLVADEAAIRNAAGGSPLELSSSQISGELRSIANRADSLLASDIFTFDAIQVGETTCRGLVCTVVYFFGDTNTIDLGSGGVVAGESGSTEVGEFVYDSVMTRNNVKLAQSRGYSLNMEEGSSRRIHQLTYQGWLEDTNFGIGVSTDMSYDFTEDSLALGLAVGDASGSAPGRELGSATWKGVMIAVESERQEIHQGDATLTLNLAASHIDVAFSFIREIETGARRVAISYDDVPLTADGFASRRNGRIEGKFFGSGHVEAGGIFERGATVGSFGARRE